MRTLLAIPCLALYCVSLAAAQTDEMPVLYKGKGIVLRAPADARWCDYGKLRLEPTVYDPDPPKNGKTRRPPSAKEKASTEEFLRQLDQDLQQAVQAADDRPPAPKGNRTMEIRPRLRRLSRNSPWLNAIGLAGLQSPIKNSSLVLELPLTDAETQKPVGSILLVGKGFFASQIDLKQNLKQFRYSLSRLGQAQSNAKAGAKEAIRQINRLSSCAAETNGQNER